MDNSLMIFLSFALFTIGLLGVLSRRNVLIFFLSIELMLNAANLLFVTFANRWDDQTGLVWVFFVFVVAAVEAAVGFALLINLFRKRQSVDIDNFNELKG
ncbi:MAG: NADH-quinone oxidoreductase subunit NuoK [Parachlamydiaceae bacterium]|nr:NADH-quinone oxidoreductase subunit NuoK [Parachlamydiaceae bacterium]